MVETEVRRTPATVEDAIILGQALRGADRAEVVAATGLDPADVVIWSVERSEECWAVWFDGELGCIYGASGLSESILEGSRADAWCLTTPVIEEHARAFWEACYAWIPELLQRWDVIENWIDTRHVKAIRWAEKLGFRLETPKPFGPEGVLFQHFTCRLEDLTGG
jgi:hypothetical protein